MDNRNRLRALAKTLNDPLPPASTPGDAAELTAWAVREIDELSGIHDAYEATMAEVCQGSRVGPEMHCTCVPHLRREIERLRTALTNITRHYEVVAGNMAQYSGVYAIAKRALDWRRDASSGFHDQITRTRLDA